jgi:hypothetical protein
MCLLAYGLVIAFPGVECHVSQDLTYSELFARLYHVHLPNHEMTRRMPSPSLTLSLSVGNLSFWPCSSS